MQERRKYRAEYKINREKQYKNNPENPGAQGRKSPGYQGLKTSGVPGVFGVGDPGVESLLVDKKYVVTSRGFINCLSDLDLQLTMQRYGNNYIE
jgi:hypothetical protein